MELRGSHVLVTGASQGIGEAMAREFAAQGARVSVAARSADKLDKIAEAIDGAAFVVDLTDAGQVDALISRVESQAGPIDVLVNNAGVEALAAFHTESADWIRTVLSLNLEAPLVLCRNVLDGFVERNKGHFLFMSSLAGTGGFPGLATYCATKAGLTNFAATIKLELKDTNIHTTVIAPGPVDTDMWDRLMEAPELEPMITRLSKCQLLPKVSPEKVAELAVDAVARNKPYVGLPKRLGLNHTLRNVPTATTALVLKGVPLGPQLNS